MSRGKEKLTELLSAYIDGEVDSSERSEVERLLQENKEAADLYARLQATRSLLNQMEIVTPPKHFLNRVRGSIANTSMNSFFERLKNKFIPRRIHVPLITYASVVVVIGITLYFAFLSTPGIPEKQETFADSALTGNLTEEKEQIQQPEAEATEERFAAAPAELDEEYLEREDSAAAGEIPSTAGANRIENLSRDEAGAPPETLAEYDTYEEATDPDTARDEEITIHTGETEYAMRATAPRERRARPTIARKASQPTMLPAGLANASMQTVRFRAELIEAYYEVPLTETESATSKSELSPYVTVTSGNEVPRDANAQPGSESNPLRESIDLSVTGLPSFDFAYFDESACSSAVLISGDVHIGSDGRVISFRLKADRSARAVLNAYAGHLRTNRILPPRQNGSRVSVEYSFIATLYCVGVN